LFEAGKAAVRRSNIVAAILRAPRMIVCACRRGERRSRRDENQRDEQCFHSGGSISKLSLALTPVSTLYQKRLCAASASIKDAQRAFVKFDKLLRRSTNFARSSLVSTQICLAAATE